MLWRGRDEVEERYCEGESLILIEKVVRETRFLWLRRERVHVGWDEYKRWWYLLWLARMSQESKRIGMILWERFEMRNNFIFEKMGFMLTYQIWIPSLSVTQNSSLGTLSRNSRLNPILSITQNSRLNPFLSITQNFSLSPNSQNSRLNSYQVIQHNFKLSPIQPRNSYLPY